MPVTNVMVMTIMFMFLATVSSYIVMNKNVVFRKVNDITTTRSKWTVSFVIDLQTYDHFIQKANTDITEAEKVAHTLVQHYQRPKEEGFLNNFVSLTKEINTLPETQNMMFNTFSDYRTLQQRQKRSLLPIFRKISSFLLGTFTDNDLDEIKGNLKKLTNNQFRFQYVLEKSFTLLNMTNVQVRENRQAINQEYMNY